MTTFDKREEGFEKQFAHDEELKFKANARRNKLLALWAAQKLRMSGVVAFLDLDEDSRAVARGAGANLGDRLVGRTFGAVLPQLPSTRSARMRRHVRRQCGASSRSLVCGAGARSRAEIRCQHRCLCQ